ncbi:MAG: hypothetical protein Q7K43_00745 [Candidatus Woesearchaeota archaeon]|nr:hypothetical protein [Candidatus Woesearchaeota archaeon]
MTIAWRPSASCRVIVLTAQEEETTRIYRRGTFFRDLGYLAGGVAVSAIIYFAFIRDGEPLKKEYVSPAQEQTYSRKN